MSVEPSSARSMICTFPVKVRENVYDFSVQLNLYGEILSVNNHFTALPPTAQQLMAGKDLEFATQQLEHWVQLLPYCGPMVAMGYLAGTNWEKMTLAIRQLKEEEAARQDMNYREIVRDEWALRAYECEESGMGRHIFTNLARLLTEDNDLEKPQYLFGVRNWDPTLVEPFLLALIPVQQERSVIKQLYRIIAAYETESGMNFLLRHLYDHERRGYHSVILMALSEIQDRQLRVSMLQPLLAYFRNAPVNVTDSDLATLLERFFGDFHQPQVERFLKSLLKGFRIAPAMTAFKILRRFGLQEEAIARDLRYIFSTPRPPIEYMKSALAIYGKMEQVQHLPYSRDLIELFLWNVGRQMDHNFIQAVAFVMRRKLGDGIYARLSPYFRHERAGVRDGVKLFFSRNAAAEFGMFRRGLQDQDPEEKKKALLNIKYLAAGYPQPQLIRTLLSMHEEVPELEAYVLEALSALLQQTPDRSVLDCMLSAASAASPRTRKAAATGLGTFLEHEKKALAVIEQLWYDPDEQVRAAAKDAYRSGLRTRRNNPGR